MIWKGEARSPTNRPEMKISEKMAEALSTKSTACKTVQSGSAGREGADMWDSAGRDFLPLPSLTCFTTMLFTLSGHVIVGVQRGWSTDGNGDRRAPALCTGAGPKPGRGRPFPNAGADRGRQLVSPLAAAFGNRIGAAFRHVPSRHPAGAGQAA